MQVKVKNIFLPLIKVLKNTVLLNKIILKTTPSRYFLILRGVLEVHFFDLYPKNNVLKKNNISRIF